MGVLPKNPPASKQQVAKLIRFLWICLGGAIGTGARYLVSGWVLQIFGPSFPFSTLTVNVAGSFLIGVINYVGMNSDLIPPNLRIILAIGVLGGFTTYSSFNYETLQYLQEGAWFLGVFNLAIMMFSCLASGVAGFIAAKVLLGH